MEVSQTGRQKTWEGTITFDANGGDDWEDLKYILSCVRDGKSQELGTVYRDLAAKLVQRMEETDEG